MVWQTIRRITGKKVGDVGQAESRNGTFIVEVKSIFCTWQEHFSKLLKPVEGTEGGRSVDPVGVMNSPSREEVVSAIELLKSSKSAEMDEIRPKMLKALGEKAVQ